VDHQGRSFAEVVEALGAVRDSEHDCAPFYPCGEEYVQMEPDFLRHPPISGEGDPIEAFVLLARQTVATVLYQVERPEWQAAIHRSWNDILTVLAIEFPETHRAVQDLGLDAIRAHGDDISISFSRGGHGSVWLRGRSELAVEDAIRQVVPELPADFRVRAWGVGLGSSCDD